MNDAERYNKELAALLAEVEVKARRAQELRNAETLDSLIRASVQVGITKDHAFQTIEADPNDYKSGAMRLIDEIKLKRIERLEFLRDRIDKKGHAILDSGKQWEADLLKFSHPFETLSDDEQRFIDDHISLWKSRIGG